MNKVVGTLAFLTSWSLVLPAAAADLEGSVSIYGLPIPRGLLGLSAEGRFPSAHLSLAAVGAFEMESPFTYGSLYGMWTPLRSDQLSVGVMMGYGLSNSGNRFGDGAVDDVLLGPVWQWEGGSWWARLNPYLGFRRRGFSIDAAAMFFASIGGPPLLEVGWRPMRHLELGLRTSPAPLRIGYVW